MKLLIRICLIFFLFFILKQTAFAHRPHDNITDVILSPDFENDGTAFAIVASRTIQVTRNHGKTWRFMSDGLDNVYSFSSLSVSSNFESDGTIYASSEGDGIYRSKNNGESWEKMNAGLRSLNIRKVACSSSPSSESAVLAVDADGRLYRMKNHSENWQIIYQKDIGIHAIAFLPATDIEQLITGDTQGNLLFYDGRQWNKIHDTPLWGSINCIAVSPFFKSDRTYWIGGENGIYKTSDSGNSFRLLDSTLTGKNLTSLVAYLSTEKQVILYASTWHEALFCSTNGGTSWKKYDQGLSTDIQADAPDFLLPHFKGISVCGSNILLGGFDGLFISNDNGVTWRQPESWPIGYLSSLALSPATDEIPEAAFLSYGGGAYLVPNANSNNWAKSARCLTLSASPGQRADSGISDVVFSPSYEKDKTIFVASELQLIKSSDRGKTWSIVNIEKPLSYKIRYKINSYLRKFGFSNKMRLKIIGFFPLIPGWSTFMAISPSFQTDGTIFFGTQGLGQCASEDWGNSCSVTYDTSNQVTTSMAISPNFSQDRTLFIGILNQGLFKSSDRGNSFKKILSLPPTVGELKLDISETYNQDHTIIVGTGNGLFLSRDGGSCWDSTRILGPEDHETITSVALSPDFQHDGTIMVAIKGHGIYQSRNFGESYSELAQELIQNNEQMKQIVFSKNYSENKTIFGISSNYPFYTTDAGKSWEKISRPIRYEDVQDTIRYSGTWQTVQGADYSDSTQTMSNTPGSRATLQFYGKNISLLGETSFDSGQANIFIDGHFFTTISFHSTGQHYVEKIFSSSELSESAHEITVEVADAPDNQGWIKIDAFEVIH